MTNANKAIVFSPPDRPFDIGHLRRRLAHIKRRGYDMIAFVCDWWIVDTALTSGSAQIVLFAYGDDTVDDDERSADPTHLTRALPSDVRRRVLSPEQVRQIIDCDATVPIGLDPEMVAAARRIAARLAEADSRGPSPRVQDQGCS